MKIMLAMTNYAKKYAIRPPLFLLSFFPQPARILALPKTKER